MINMESSNTIEFQKYVIAYHRESKLHLKYVFRCSNKQVSLIKIFETRVRVITSESTYYKVEQRDLSIYQPCKY